MRNCLINKLFILITATIFLSVIFTTSLHAQDLIMSVDLKGQWKFMIGDNPDWKDPEYDDSKWETIYVPGAWENQGFHGYDGYAWYRKTLIIPNITERTNYYLDLGYIDDVDQAYINGKPVGKTGSFPPDYSTAYKARRLYPIPGDLFNETNKITLAIRVYDEIGEGGIISGNIGIWYDKFSLFPDLDLKGEWKFRPGRCSDPTDIQWIYDAWNDIHVPGAWEEQGYKNLDGVACYAKQFSLNGQFDGKHMVLLVGKIDDLDMVYINGQLVGQSGDFLPSTLDRRRDQYLLLRGYYLPDDVLNQNGKNIIVVRVLDVMGQGGIWEGPVGLITQENYIKYWRKKRSSSF